jgi:hypothetical protein
MLSIVKSIKKETCRECIVSENDKLSFHTLDHIQRYNPILEFFPHPEEVQSKLNLELPSMYQISEWQNEHKPNFWKATRINHGTKEQEQCEVYTKIIHLLNPMDVLRKKYATPSHPFLPQTTDQWKEIIQKVHSRNNQAYIDYLLNFVLSRFREMDLTPHCVLFYGSFTGISKKYKFNISNEYDTYRNCRWFWDGIAEKRAKIVVNDDLPEELYNEIITPPFENDEELHPLDLESDSVSVHSATSFSFDDIKQNVTDVTDVTDMTDMTHVTDAIDIETESSDPPDVSLDTLTLDELSEPSVDSNNDNSDSEDDSEEDDEDDDDDIPIEIGLELSNIPVITIAQEAQEGILDTLIDDDEIDGHKHGSAAWEERWVAWLFQIISALTFLQSTIHFTHNDLHSNNILWRSTDKPYLFYKTKEGDLWRVPTYGKIFSIIDFGRSIFRLGKKEFISDDHWPDQDASDQYNFGPFYDATRPKVKPNMSFDLCRLSISLIDGLFEEVPPKKKGKKIMSQEGSWKVYETKSELYNLLWGWTVDDAGRTIYEDEEGNEKYDGFDLYIHIAHDVHNAVPRDQLYKPMFDLFRYKSDVDEKVYSLGI